MNPPLYESQLHNIHLLPSLPVLPIFDVLTSFSEFNRNVKGKKLRVHTRPLSLTTKNCTTFPAPIL